MSLPGVQGPRRQCSGQRAALAWVAGRDSQLMTASQPDPVGAVEVAGASWTLSGTAPRPRQRHLEPVRVRTRLPVSGVSSAASEQVPLCARPARAPVLPLQSSCVTVDQSPALSEPRALSFTRDMRGCRGDLCGA